MKILVFVKQVPDTDEVALDPKTGNLKREGVKSTINPLDENAIETALQLKESYGGSVYAVCMGPPQAGDVLKKALALGCDEAFLLSDRAFGGADTLATSYTLAKSAEKIGDYDLLVFGRHAVDGDTAQTGPATAAQLGIPQVTLVSSVRVEEDYLICERDLEDSTERVRVKMPAVITVTGDINTPRYATPINIMKAMKKKQTIWNAQDLNADPAYIGAKGSPSSTKKVMEPPKRNTDTTYFTGNPAEIAVQIADMLQEEHLI